ncbi:TetR family transcriptional regulator [Leifsonia xyli]|uniref:TetR family transcriptional regulator n=1 Tax=Leifsonia xyli TaxID=1575 RepID=UPI0009DBABEA|nr:TetR family transcriptional regulator [Leifsonia xyli]
MTGTESTRRHTRDDVAEAALRILDDVGLPDLTMRRLAAALEVQPSALYWHFPNKQTLLAELADRIVASAATSVRPEPCGSWTSGVRAEADRLRDALLACRDGAEVVASTLALGLGSTVARDRLASAVAGGGFDAATSRRAADALLHFILGHVSHEQQRTQYDSFGVLTGADRGAATGAEDPVGGFGFGVGLLVGGLELTRSRK